MEEISTIGIDIAKSVFQVHAISAAGEVVVRRQLKRRQVLQFFAGLKPCLVGMEACATAHHWARELMKLGHEVRLMPPRCVKPYVKRNKNDAADAEAICEAVTRPTMRFVPVKTVDQQSVLMLHRTRQLFIRQRTTLINSIRAHLAEFGIVAGIGRNGVEALLEVVAKGEDDSLDRSVLDVLFHADPAKRGRHAAHPAANVLAYRWMVKRKPSSLSRRLASLRDMARVGEAARFRPYLHRPGLRRSVRVGCQVGRNARRRVARDASEGHPVGC
jgi:transposase